MEKRTWKPRTVPATSATYISGWGPARVTGGSENSEPIRIRTDPESVTFRIGAVVALTGKRTGSSPWGRNSTS